MHNLHDMDGDAAESQPMVPRWSLGDRLRKARDHAGLGQTELARLLGVTHGAVSKWETDRGVPRDVLTVVQRWADVTGVDPRWILWGAADGPSDSVTLGQPGILGSVALPDGQMELFYPPINMREQPALADA